MTPTPCKATRLDVRAFFELPTEFQHRHHAFERGDFTIGVGRQLLMDTNRDSTTVVLHSDAAVIVDRDGDGGRESSHRFVDRVVDDFADKVMESIAIGVSDVHSGALANMLEVGKVLEVLVRVLVVRRLGDGLMLIGEAETEVADSSAAAACSEVDSEESEAGSDRS